MSKKYLLTGALTYATVKRVFTAGVEYTANEVGSLANEEHINGAPLFTEVEVSDEVVTGDKPKTIVINKDKGEGVTV